MKNLLIPALIFTLAWSLWPTEEKEELPKRRLTSTNAKEKPLQKSRVTKKDTSSVEEEIIIDPTEDELAPKTIFDIGLNEESVKNIMSESKIDEFIQMAENVEFTQEDLVDSSEELAELCPIESKEESCTIVKEVYQNSDGSQSRITTVDGRPFLKQIRFPNGEKFVVYLGDRGDEFETIAMTVSGTKVAIDFDPEGRVSYYRNLQSGYFFEQKYKDGHKTEGSIGTLHGPNEKWVEIPIPAHL